MEGYFAFLHPPVGSGEWAVTFPDLDGCFSAGADFASAAHAAREALSGHLAALRSDGDPIPPSRTWDEIQADDAVMAEARGAFAQFVEPRGIVGERVRVNIMIDKGLLREADESADTAGMTRSGYIEAALLAYKPAARGLQPLVP